MKHWWIGILVGITLIGCGNTTPPSPVGTWTDSAVNGNGICVSGNQALFQFIFIIAEPSSSGAISATLRVKQQGNQDTVLALSGTFNGSSMSITDPNNSFLPVVNGSFDFSQKRFTGTLSGKCYSSSNTIGTFNFTAIKQ